MCEETVNPKILKTIRESAGLTQKEFASMFSIPLRTYQNWETGTRRCPVYVYRMMIQILAPLQAHGVDLHEKARENGILYGLID